MFAKTNETVLKVVTIIAILVMFVILYTTGIASVFGSLSPSNMLLHKLAALIIIALIITHAWLRRCTIKKLWQEFIATLLNKQIRHEDNIDFLMQNTKNQSFKELCSLLNYDVSFLQQKLEENHVKIDSVEHTLKTIAKNNDKDMFQILLLMLKLHVEKSIPSPIYTSSCERV
jgi:hypothetical protein